VLNLLQKWFSGRTFPVDVFKRPSVLMGVGAALSLLIVAIMWRSQATYVPLYGTHQKVSVDEVSGVLAGEHIDFRINPDNGQLLVDSRQLPRARMVLAGKNIQPLMAPGLELMDKDEVLGASQYIQNIRYQRGLEGELARSITTISGIEEARVHLGIQAESGFVLSDQPPSSASVVLSLSPGRTLTPLQVRAITQLVAGSVPGLSASNVHVVDQTGTLLNDGDSDDEPQATSGTLQALALPVIRNLNQLLDPAVGHDNYRVTVMPSLDLRQQEQTDEKLQGDPRVLEEQITLDNHSDLPASGVPGSLSNRAPAESRSEDTGKSNQTHSQTARKYAYDRQVTHIRYPHQQLARLQIAVILNGSATGIASMTEAQLTQLKSVLESAAGMDLPRGDTLSLDKVNFVAANKVPVPVISWWQQPDIQFWAIWGGSGLLGVLLLVMVVRPWINRRVGQQPVAETASLSESTVAGESAATERHQFDSERELPPRASGIEDKVAYLQQLAENETDRLAEVIKQWINSNDRSRDNV